jgi:hypothetical protein
MLIDLKLYYADFEKKLIEDSYKFYSEEAYNQSTNLSINEYLELIDKRLKEEEDRTTNYLESNTGKQLIKCIEEELILNKKHNLINGFENLITGDKNLISINKLYQFLGRVSILKELKIIWGQWITASVKIIVTNSIEKDNIIKELMKLKT